MSKEKVGRKYDREKWGWKDESEIIDHNCHYSGLPSPSSYEDKHHYYNNDRKLKTEKFSLQAIGVCIVAIVTLTVLIIIL
tara:strand:+ start:558 stop:797 length:240 start_codon:yes stop_codon:yes gene_type:complete